MLEACVSLRRGTQNRGEIGDSATDLKQVGDVVAVKRSPAVWSDRERQEFLICKLDDPAIEASMRKSLRVRPYAVVTDGVETCRSRYRVDLDQFAGSPGLDINDTTSEPVPPNDKPALELSDMIDNASSRT